MSDETNTLLDGVAEALGKVAIKSVNAQLRGTFGQGALQLPFTARPVDVERASDLVLAYRKLQFRYAPGPVNTKGVRFPVRLTK